MAIERSEARKIENNKGTIAMLLSLIAMVGGFVTGHIIVGVIGAYSFVKLVHNLCSTVNKYLESTTRVEEMKAYAEKRKVDAKIDLIAKAYQDGKVSNEDISYLVRSLASNNEVPKVINNNNTDNRIKPLNTISVDNSKVKVVSTVEQKVEQKKIETKTQPPVKDKQSKVDTTQEPEKESDDEIVDPKTYSLKGSYEMFDFKSPFASIKIKDEVYTFNLLKDFNTDMSNVPHEDCNHLRAWHKIIIDGKNCYLYLNGVEKKIELRHI